MSGQLSIFLFKAVAPDHIVVVVKYVAFFFFFFLSGCRVVGHMTCDPAKHCHHHLISIVRSVYNNVLGTSSAMLPF